MLPLTKRADRIPLGQHSRVTCLPLILMALKDRAAFNQNRGRGIRRSPASMSQRVLRGAIVPVSLMLTCIASPHSWADAIFAPGDFIMGGQKDMENQFFNIGFGAGSVGSNSWPDGESPDHAIDGVAQKYLNFGKLNTGFLVTPFFNEGNGSVATSMQLWTANDAVDRDPATYEIWGTNETLDFQEFSFEMADFTQVSSGALALPAKRPAVKRPPAPAPGSPFAEMGRRAPR